MFHRPYNGIDDKLLVLRWDVEQRWKTVLIDRLQKTGIVRYTLLSHSLPRSTDSTYLQKLKEPNSMLGIILKVCRNHGESTLKHGLQNSWNVFDNVAF